jgi:hypothetical protein
MAGLEETGGGLLLALTLLTLTSGAMTLPGTSKVIALATLRRSNCSAFEPHLKAAGFASS